MKRLSVVLLAFVLGCPSKPEPVTPPNPVFEPGTCAEWCDHAAELHCEAAKPTPRGASCETVCEHNETVGVSHFNLGCRKKARTCAAADACEN